MVETTIQTNQGMQTVKGTNVGPFTIHKAPDLDPSYKPEWTVTHRASGLRIRSYRTRKEAVAAATSLAALPVDWSKTDGKHYTRAESKMILDTLNRHWMAQYL